MEKVTKVERFLDALDAFMNSIDSTSTENASKTAGNSPKNDLNDSDDKSIEKQRTNVFNYLYDRIENCCSLEWLLGEINKNIDVLTKKDILTIFNYYSKFK